MSRPPQLRCEQVGRRFGDRHALSEVTLTVASGERVALIGPSGSGKSTLLRVLMGALKPSSGAVFVGGQDLASLGPGALRSYRAGCGIIEQGGNLVPQLSVHRNVLAGRLPAWPFYRTLWSMMWPIERERTRALLDRVELADRQWDLTSILSGGEQQRVAIARALANQPGVIFADEPTSSLDPTTSADMVRLLLNVSASDNASLVFCTHWVSLVRERVDRVVGLRDGRLVLDVSATDLTDAHLDALYAGSRERR